MPKFITAASNSPLPGQRFATAEIRLGMEAACLVDHAFGEVHTERNGAAQRPRPRHGQPAGDVEQFYSFLTHGVEQRFNRLHGESTERLVIILGNTLPTRQFKGVKFLQFENHKGYSQCSIAL
jgi:hypothetical protein